VAAAERIPPKLYSEVHHLTSIQDGVLRTHTDIHYTILHSEVDVVRVALAEGMNVLSVTGEGVGEWQETTQGDQRILLIPLTYGKKGATTVHLTTETALSESGLANAFVGIRTVDTVRETGFIGLELATSAEVIVAEDVGLEKVPVQKLPRPLVDKSARPLIAGFKYLKHPYSLVFDVKRHEKVAVPVATIHSASVVTLFTEDGKVVHRLVYRMKNSAKQFLEIQLPKNADVWSVFVGNQPAESSVNDKGKLLVPLIRSRSEDDRLDSFPVEVVYCTVRNRFSPFGSQAAALPAVDVLVSQVMWSVYLPNDYSYVYFQSSLEKEEMIRGVNLLAGAQRQYDKDAIKELGEREARPSSDELRKIYKGKDYRSQFRNVPMEESDLASQVDAELQFSGRLEALAGEEGTLPLSPGGMSTGVMPIHIRVPTGGQVYRFARTIVQPGDPLTFSVTYTQSWVVTLLKWLVFALIVFILYRARNRLTDIGRWGGNKLSPVVRGLAALLRKRMQARATAPPSAGDPGPSQA
jgi:hypothetical protein